MPELICCIASAIELAYEARNFLPVRMALGF
jgi:hypothetical protein